MTNALIKQAMSSDEGRFLSAGKSMSGLGAGTDVHSKTDRDNGSLGSMTAQVNYINRQVGSNRDKPVAKSSRSNATKDYDLVLTDNLEPVKLKNDTANISHSSFEAKSNTIDSK